MNRSKVRLTDLLIRAMAPGEEVSDADVPGLKLRMLPSGRREWSWRGGVPRRRVKLTDDYPKLSLAEARKEAKALAGHASAGADPATAREEARRQKAERAAKEAAKAEGRPDPGSLAAVAARYLAHAKRSTRPRTYAEEARKLAVEILPKLGQRPMAEIRRGEVALFLEEIRDQRGGVCSNRTRSILVRLFNFAADRELVPGSPVPRQRLHKETERQRVLNSAEVRALWLATDALGLLSRCAWRLVLLTAQRPGEVMGMRWADLVHERGETWWHLPASATKTNREHRVFLSGQALAEVETLRPLTGHTPYVFASERANGKPMAWLSQSSPRLRRRVAAELARQAAEVGAPVPMPERFTPHDCRRTASTIMGEHGVRPDVVDRCLNHAPAKISRTYNTARYAPEVRQALLTLGAAVERIVIGAEPGRVLAFPAAAQL